MTTALPLTFTNLSPQKHAYAPTPSSLSRARSPAAGCCTARLLVTRRHSCSCPTPSIYGMERRSRDRWVHCRRLARSVLSRRPRVAYENRAPRV